MLTAFTELFCWSAGQPRSWLFLQPCSVFKEGRIKHLYQVVRQLRENEWKEKAFLSLQKQPQRKVSKGDLPVPSVKYGQLKGTKPKKLNKVVLLFPCRMNHIPPYLFLSREDTMTSETSENTIFVYFTLCYLLLSSNSTPGLAGPGGLTFKRLVSDSEIAKQPLSRLKLYYLRCLSDFAYFESWFRTSTPK